MAQAAGYPPDPADAAGLSVPEQLPGKHPANVAAGGAGGESVYVPLRGYGRRGDRYHPRL